MDTPGDVEDGLLFADVAEVVGVEVDYVGDVFEEVGVNLYPELDREVHEAEGRILLCLPCGLLFFSLDGSFVGVLGVVLGVIVVLSGDGRLSGIWISS